MTIRVTTGRPFRSHISEALSRLCFGTPPGLILCGFLGLIVMVNPWMKAMTRLIDGFLREPCHCDEAVVRSIERAGQ